MCIVLKTEMTLAYCRFGNADIYLFHDCSGCITCCGCSLFGGMFSGGKDPVFFTRVDAIKHIKDHLKIGDYVHLDVIEDLEEEIRNLGNFVYNDDPPKDGELCILEKKLIKGDSVNEK